MTNPTPTLHGLTLPQALRILTALRDRTASPQDEEWAFARFCLDNVGWSQAQHLQDLWVAYELKSRRNGFFVEFGAMDGIILSNTYALERHLGWTGILAEPARLWRSALPANRACAVDHRCVWSRTGEKLPFIQTALTGLSTIESFADSDRNAQYRQHGERYEVETVSFNDLLRDWSAPRRIDFLSIDTEGSEYEILKSFDWDRYDIRLIAVEHAMTEKRELLFDLLSSKGYRRKFENLSRDDDWYVRHY